jgi:hypothetical protein
MEQDACYASPSSRTSDLGRPLRRGAGHSCWTLVSIMTVHSRTLHPCCTFGPPSPPACCPAPGWDTAKGRGGQSLSHTGRSDECRGCFAPHRSLFAARDLQVKFCSASPALEGNRRIQRRCLTWCSDAPCHTRTGNKLIRMRSMSATASLATV